MVNSFQDLHAWSCGPVDSVFVYSDTEHDRVTEDREAHTTFSGSSLRMKHKDSKPGVLFNIPTPSDLYLKPVPPSVHYLSKTPSNHGFTNGLINSWGH